MNQVSSRRLYMDNAATSFPKPEVVVEALIYYATKVGASAGRGAYREAVESGALIAECRQQLCRFFNGEKPEHFIFTLNCSDALNLAIKGMVDPGQRAHFICTEIDHNSVLRPMNALLEQGRIELTRVRIDPETGFIDPADIARAIRPTTRMITITHASNVTGTLQPLREIGLIAKTHGVPLLVDAAQSAGHVPIDVQADHIDMLASPGHKGLLGPLGTGFLYIRPGLENMVRIVREGGTGSVSEQDRHPEFMPDKFEAGSHNAIGIAGLLAGLKWHGEQTMEKLAAHDGALTAAFVRRLREMDDVTYYGPRGAEGRVGVFSVKIEGYTPHELAARLEGEYGILTRPGLHCAPLIHRALGTVPVGGTTRFSFGPFLTESDVEFAADALAAIAASRPRLKSNGVFALAGETNERRS
jgi:cysteine desulfurase / selenocysteine lyase